MTNLPVHKPLVAVGNVSILIFSTLEEGDPNVHGLDNTPGVVWGSRDSIPYLLFVESIRDNNDKALREAINLFIDKIDIRNTLDFKTLNKAKVWSAYRAESELQASFIKLINGPQTAEHRKRIYKAMAWPTALFNIDGLLLKVKRTKGDVQFAIQSGWIGRTIHDWSKLTQAYFLFHQKWWGEAIDHNFYRHTYLKSVKRVYWPEDLKPKNFDIYTGIKDKPVKSNPVPEPLV